MVSMSAPTTPNRRRSLGGRPSKGDRRLVGAHIPLAYAEKLDRMVDTGMIPSKSAYITEVMTRALDQVEFGDPVPGQQSLNVTAEDQQAEPQDHMPLK